MLPLSVALAIGYPTMAAFKRKRIKQAKFQATLRLLDYDDYYRCKNASTQAVRNAKCNFKQEITDSKRFWKYVQFKPIVMQSVSSIQRPEGSVTTNDTEIEQFLWLMQFFLMNILLRCPFYLSSFQVHPFHLWMFLLTSSGINCANLIQQSLTILMDATL